MLLTKVLLLILLFGIQQGISYYPIMKNRVLMCFYASWAQNRTLPGTFTPRNIDANLCSFIVFSYATVDDRQLIALNGNDYVLYRDIMFLKRVNPALRILLCVGGTKQNTTHFRQAAASDQAIDRFADNIISYVRRFDFDGVVMTWLYPTVDGGPASDKERFSALLQRTSRMFKKEARLTWRMPLVLAATVSANSEIMQQAYELDKIHNYVDMLVLMSTEMNTYKDKKLGFNSPLPRFTPHDPSDTNDTRNLDWVVREYVSKGTPRSKILMGIPTFSTTFKLPLTGDTVPGTPTDLTPEDSVYTKQTGLYAFYEVCKMLTAEGWTFKWDVDAQVPYAYGPINNNRSRYWVSYENHKSLLIKSDYIRNWGLRGAAVWSLDLDDFPGICGLRPYPILHVLSWALAPGFPYVEPAFGIPPPDGGSCVRDGVYPDPVDCRNYFQCVQGVLTRHSCANGTRFHAIRQACVNDTDVPGCL